MEWPLVKTVTQRGLSKLPTALANPILKRLAPFDSEKVIVDFTTYTPFIMIDPHHHTNELRMEIVIRNFSYYSITHYNCECCISINGGIFIIIKDSNFFILKPGQRHTYSFRYPLSDSEVRRTQKIFGEQKVVIAEYHFKFVGQTRFGPEIIDVRKSHALTS